MDFVEKLYKQGDVSSKPKMYALGRVVIWSNHKNFNSSKGFENLKEPWIKKIAIANPTHAPYGEKAKQAMESLNIYDTLKSKFVLGENISQTVAFIESGGADIGVIALSLALAPNIANGDTDADRLEYLNIEVDESGEKVYEWSSNRYLYRKGVTTTIDIAEADLAAGQRVLVLHHCSTQ